MRQRPSRATEKGGVPTSARGHQENTPKVRRTALRPGAASSTLAASPGKASQSRQPGRDRGAESQRPSGCELGFRRA